MKKLFTSIFILSVTWCAMAQAEDLVRKNNARLISGNYYSYKNSIYVLEEHNYLKKLDDANAASFRVLSGAFAKDTKHVFYGGVRIQQADPVTFKVLDDTPFAKDKLYAFFQYHVIPNVDIDTFTALNSTYAKDSKHIYQYYRTDNHVVKGADISTFKVFDNKSAYAVDRFNAFYDGKPVQGADPLTFVPIGGGYARDKNLIYCLNEKIADFDYASFRVIGSGIYGKDKDGVYILYSHCDTKDELKITGADPDTFEELFIHQDAFYAKDINHVYINNIVRKDIDVATFRVLNVAYSVDKNGVYKYGELIEGVDLKTFDPRSLDGGKQKP